MTGHKVAPKKLFRISTLIVVTTLLLTSCASNLNQTVETGKGTVTIVTNNSRQLVYKATGTSAPNAPDDASITILPTKFDEGITDYGTLLPLTRTVRGVFDEKISMTVKSYADEGEVNCEIRYQYTVIKNTAHGHQPSVTCEYTFPSQ